MCFYISTIYRNQFVKLILRIYTYSVLLYRIDLIMNYFLTNRLLFLILMLIGFVSCEQDDNQLPSVIDFEIQLTDSIAPASISFVNTSVNLESFEWDFGDGTISHEESPVHIFNQEGEYTILLKAWNDQEYYVVEKTIRLTKVYDYIISNNSTYTLYNLTSYYSDATQNYAAINHGLLNAFETSSQCQTSSKNLYVSFEDNNGRKYRTAFPYSLSDGMLNELVIDKYTLIIVAP